MCRTARLASIPRFRPTRLSLPGVGAAHNGAMNESISSPGSSDRVASAPDAVAASEPARSPVPHPTRVAVVGTGAVGSTFAFSLLLSGLASEILLVDANARKAEGEAMDLAHAVPFAKTARVWSGPIEETAGAAITVISAGAAQKPGETRLDLLRKNAAIFRQIVPPVAAANPGGIIIVATNPVDILSYLTWRISGLPASRVIGSGTILDTGRFRYLLAEHYGVDPRSVHAYIAGEHGDSEVPVWSSANIAGMPLADFAEANGVGHDQAVLRRIFEDTREGRDLLRGRGGPGPNRRGNPARPVDGALRVVADPRLLRDRRRLLVGARGRRAGGHRTDAPPGPLGRGGVGAPEVGSAAALDVRGAWARRGLTGLAG